jgi:hypothetical protein
MHPELVHGLALLAPAIDNDEHNFESVPPSQWYMPARYVTTLRDDLPSRPRITVEMTIVHGLRDTDRGGSAPWRVREYVKELLGDGVVQFHEPDVDHTLEPWLSNPSNTPSLEKLVESLLQS